MCEMPYDYSNYGVRCLLPLDQINFKTTFQNHPRSYLIFKNELIEDLLSMKHQPLDYALGFKMFYQMSLHCLERDSNKLENGEPIEEKMKIFLLKIYKGLLKLKKEF